MADRTRGERLQIMLSPEELTVLDDFRFKKRMPSRAAAVRELLKRGLAAEGFRACPVRVKIERIWRGRQDAGGPALRLEPTGVVRRRRGGA